ncbi:MAG: WD40 repeat domain-containing protein [Myxococcales bacterium]
MRGWKRLTGRLTFATIFGISIAVACSRGTSTGPGSTSSSNDAGAEPDGGVVPPPTDGGTPDAGPPPSSIFGTPGPWPATNVTFSEADGLFAGDLGSGVVGITTDESQNIWIATRGALYVKRAPAPDGSRPADTTFRRFDGTGGHGTVIDTALHLQNNAVNYHDVGLADGIDGFFRGAASDPGIVSVVGGGPDEVFVGYASDHDFLSPDDGTSKDPFRHMGKIDRVRLKSDGSIEVVRFDMVSGNSTGFWHCREVWRMVYDHFIHKHELYVGTEHGVDKISPDKWFLSTKSWIYTDNLVWMADHLHPRACKNQYCTGDDGKDTQMMGDWKALAIGPDGDLWVGGKWSAGKIVYTELPAELNPDGTPNPQGVTGWFQRPGSEAFKYTFGDPWCGSSGRVNQWVDGKGWILTSCPPLTGIPPVFLPPSEGDTVNIVAVTVAPDGLVWWASPQYGIASFDETKNGFNYFDPGSMGVGGTVTDLVALPDGRLAIGSDGGGLTLWDPKTHESKTMRAGSGLLDDNVRNLELDTMVNPPALHVSTATGAARIRIFP